MYPEAETGKRKEMKKWLTVILILALFALPMTATAEEKTLTAKEFDLLSFLASHPDRVYTKDELFREIWDMESFGDIATVTVHIKKIREKIEENAVNPQYIETIWGKGYRFKI